MILYYSHQWASVSKFHENRKFELLPKLMKKIKVAYISEGKTNNLVCILSRGIWFQAKKNIAMSFNATPLRLKN